MPTSPNSLKLLKKKPLAKKPKTAALLKPSATSATKNKANSLAKHKGPAPVEATLKLLKKHYPDAHCALDHSNPFELLVATILSAQCTDERVNKVTPSLFAQFPTAEKLSKADLSDVEGHIKSTNFFKNKAKNLIGMAQRLVDKHKGDVPQKMEQLVELPGVGRKTANVVLGNAFHQATGIVVDTHVARLSQRLGWTRQEEPVKIELDLQKLIPEDHWIQISHELIFHGRQICKARKPDCPNCFLFDLCPKRNVK